MCFNFQLPNIISFLIPQLVNLNQFLSFLFHLAKSKSSNRSRWVVAIVSLCDSMSESPRELYSPPSLFHLVEAINHGEQEYIRHLHHRWMEIDAQWRGRIDGRCLVAAKNEMDKGRCCWVFAVGRGYRREVDGREWGWEESVKSEGKIQMQDSKLEKSAGLKS